MRSSLTCLFLCLVFLAGCGLKDDLYLPESKPHPATTDSSEEENDAEGA